MSYILDALNKADTERERQRSGVPGLHAQAGLDTERAAGGAGPWRWVALVAVMLLAALLAWLWLDRSEAPASAVPMAAVPAAAAPAPTPGLPMETVLTPTAPVTSPAPASPPAIDTRVAALPPAAPSAVIDRPAAQPAPLAVRTPAAPPPSAVAIAKPATTAAAASAPTRLPSRNELPAELRAALPPLNVSGAVYAPPPGARMLFVNGLVLREGDAVAEGLTVERIGASATVLVFRGQRFEVKH